MDQDPSKFKRNKFNLPNGENKKNKNEDKDKEIPMKEVEKPGMKLLQTQNLEITQRLDYDWEPVLTKSPTNPFPLAPKDLVESGFVTEENYKEQNAGIRTFCFQKMAHDLRDLISHPNFEDKNTPKGVEILGAGLMRDLYWILQVDRDLKIKIRDMTNVAINNANKFVKEFELKDKVEVIKTEIEDAWKKGMINEQDTIAYYGGQFIQNQDPKTMVRMMCHFGEFLKLPSTPPRRIYLLHARGEDNPLDKVKWRNTITYTDQDILIPVEEGFGYSDKELLMPLEEGLGAKIKMEVLGKHDYYHQKYTLLRIMQA